MTHHASAGFWACYNALPAASRALADKQFELLTVNPRHPSLHFKRVGRFHSARIGAHYRALAVDASDGVLWFWIGTHAEYDRTMLGADSHAVEAPAARTHFTGVSAAQASVEVVE